jgi:hypothetical protein
MGEELLVTDSRPGGRSFTLFTNDRGGVGFRDLITGVEFGNYATFPDALRAAERNGYHVPAKE